MIRGSWKSSKGRRSIGLGVVLLILIGSSPAWAGRWDSKLEKIERKLEKGRWEQARAACLKVRKRLVAEEHRSNLAVAPAARSLALQAVAEAGLGHDRAARWYWLAAQSYLKGLPALDLDRFGPAGEFLEQLSVDHTPKPWIAPAAPQGASYRPVRVQVARQPTFPESFRGSPKGRIHLEVIVGTDGRAHRPRVLDAGPVPVAAFPVLDAMLFWRFQPASRGDHLIHAVYELTVSYP